MRPPAAVAALALAACSQEHAYVAQSDVDTFLQAPNDVVDILFVVDESNSMEEEQTALAAGFQSFLTELENGGLDGAGADFHLGLVSTSQDTDDPHRGELIGEPPYLTPQDDYFALFTERVQLGTHGSDKEKGLEAAALALSPELLVGRNQGFLRPEANLLVVIVSDEEDCSDAGALDGQDSLQCYEQPTSLTPVRNLLLDIHAAKGGDGALVNLGAIVRPAWWACAEDAYLGSRYVEAVALTGGVLGLICESDYSVVLQRLGLSALGIQDTFVLENAADPATIELTLDGVPVPEDPVNGWTYDWIYQSITLHGTSVPPRGSTVVVEYDIDPGG